MDGLTGRRGDDGGGDASDRRGEHCRCPRVPTCGSFEPGGVTRDERGVTRDERGQRIHATHSVRGLRVLADGASKLPQVADSAPMSSGWSNRYDRTEYPGPIATQDRAW